MTSKEKLEGCLVGGAIGDSIGLRFEGSSANDFLNLNFEWKISDDTQLTIATCEAIYNSSISPEKVAHRFLNWFNRGALTGLGASTLKALRELQMGGHWALVGRSGEYAAGNGAAMRIAPLAFKQNVSRTTIKDICSITHKNDEAYAGALAIYYSVCFSLNGHWKGDTNLIRLILEKLPDTRVKDRLTELDGLTHQSILEIAKMYPSTGYVVDSVPIAVFASQKINESSFENIITELIRIGRDTDTTCSMAGQIIGSLKGTSVIPEDWLIRYRNLEVSALIDTLVREWTH